MMTDPIADMLTRIRNANTAMHDEVRMPASKQKIALATILHKEGYIHGFSTAPSTTGPGDVLTISMKYSAERHRTISGLRRISTPGPSGLPQGRRCTARPRRVSVWLSCPPARG
jgi:small subunit ribosomal protein S8